MEEGNGIGKAGNVLTKQFPKEERYGLTSQLQRAVISIPANIAEGIGRNYKKDTIQFLHIARGSLYEVETLLRIAVMIETIKEEDHQLFPALIEDTLKILNGLISYYERSNLK
jgi:four helix bundle protein